MQSEGSPREGVQRQLLPVADLRCRTLESVLRSDIWKLVHLQARFSWKGFSLLKRNLLRTPRNYEYSSELSMEMSSLNAADKLVTQCPAAEEI